ncbi:MAG: cytochrome c [Gammaproteobacteria bacterium]|nr:cytochrome c [Gammaproteobacteria bacterium]
MQKLMAMILMVSLSLALTGCYQSNSEEPPPDAIQIQAAPPVGLTASGSTYYQTNCATCHKAGADDVTSAFGASDLAQKQDMIVIDMSTYDMFSSFNLMMAFSSVPDQRVADLKSYLESIPKI